MPIGKHTDPEIKAAIKKIRNEGLSISEASTQYDVFSQAIMNQDQLAKPIKSPI